MLTGFMDDAVIVHSAVAVPGKTGNPSFLFGGSEMSLIQFGVNTR
jgi:hypothetical protein